LCGITLKSFNDEVIFVRTIIVFRGIEMKNSHFEI